MIETQQRPLDALWAVRSIGLGLVQSIAFLIVYRFYLNEELGHQGFVIEASTTFDVIMGIAFCSVIVASVPDRMTSISSAIVITLGYFGAIPIVWVAILANGDYEVEGLWLAFLATGFMILLGIATSRLGGAIDRQRGQRSPIEERKRDRVLLGAIALLIGFLMVRRGPSFTIHPLTSEIYDVRLPLRESLAGADLLTNLAPPLVSSLFAPYAIARGYYRRNPVLFLAGMFGAFYIFSLTAARAPVFKGLLALMFVVLAGQLARRHRAAFLVPSMLLTAWMFEVFSGNEFLARAVIRRMVAIPALLAVRYFDFFSRNEPTYLRGTIFNPLASPYDRTPPRLIGLEYYSSNEANANSGVIGSSFALGGIIGLVFCALLLALVVRWLDRSARGADPSLVALGATYGSFVMLNSDVVGVFIRHGLLAIGVLLVVGASSTVSLNPPGRAAPLPRGARSVP